MSDSWVAACLGAATGATEPVQSFLAEGGIAGRLTSAADCKLLNECGIWVEEGVSLLEIALQRDSADVATLLLGALQQTPQGSRRVSADVPMTPATPDADTRDMVRRQISNLATDLTPRSRTVSFRRDFGDLDPTLLPDGVRGELQACRRQRADGLAYLELPAEPSAPSFFLPSQIAGADKEVRSLGLGLFVEAKECLEPIEAAVGWWPAHGAAHVVPVYTSADLNCLLHACSLGIGGVRDTLVQPLGDGRRLLRDCMHAGLAGCPALLEAAQRPAGRREDRSTEVLAMAQRDRAALDGAHMFALANVLRRPLVCHAPAEHEGAEVRHVLTVPFRMSGVYLPLMWDPKDCSPDPLALAYTRGHFTGLCPVEPGDGKPAVAIPLYDADGAALPVPYASAADAAASTFGGGDWLGWAGPPPAGVDGGGSKAQECQDLLARYLRPVALKGGLGATLRCPAAGGGAGLVGPGVGTAGHASGGTSLEVYRGVVGSAMRRRLGF